jgi:DNA/RNA endonuclease YhcR with UshA esterase domain
MAVIKMQRKRPFKQVYPVRGVLCLSLLGKKERFTMRKMRVSLITIALVLILKGMSVAQEIVPWDQADKYYGKNVTVEGTIVSTAIGRKGKECFLNFSSDLGKGLTAVIFLGDYSNFPANPEEFYKDHEVRITGVVQEYGGKPEIILNDPSQVQILK